jgi:hypothetical protein
LAGEPNQDVLGGDAGAGVGGAEFFSAGEPNQDVFGGDAWAGVGGAEFFLAGEPNQDVLGGGAGAGCDDEGGTFVAAGIALGFPATLTAAERITKIMTVTDAVRINNAAGRFGSSTNVFAPRVSLAPNVVDTDLK